MIFFLYLNFGKISCDFTHLVSTRLQPGVAIGVLGEPFQRLARREKPLKRLFSFPTISPG
jgi:hypothetical protein